MVYFIIRPHALDSGERLYQLSIIHKAGVGDFGPELSSAMFPKGDEFKELLYSKRIHLLL